MERGKQVFLFIVFFLLVSAGVFAESNVPTDVSKYIEGFLEEGGVKEKVTSVEEVNRSVLPDEILIDDFDENNVGIYEVEYGDENTTEKVFVITYLTQNFTETETVRAVKSIQYFTFGREKLTKKSDYLDSANGVKTGEEIGYVMLRAGSVTGVSTSLSLEGEGRVHISIYKNGVDSGLRNTISSDDSKKIDYDIQSEDIVTFEPGDVLSIYVEQEGDVSWGSVVSSLEVTNG